MTKLKPWGDGGPHQDKEFIDKTKVVFEVVRLAIAGFFSHEGRTKAIALGAILGSPPLLSYFYGALNFKPAGSTGFPSPFPSGWIELLLWAAIISIVVTILMTLRPLDRGTRLLFSGWSVIVASVALFHAVSLFSLPNPFGVVAGNSAWSVVPVSVAAGAAFAAYMARYD